MGIGRFRMGFRGALFTGGAVALALAGLIFWLGARHDREIDALVRDGQLVQGQFAREESGHCSTDQGRRRCEADRIYVAYTVNGRAYETAMAKPTSNAGPVFEQALIATPRLGPDQPWQVVYLPSDPAVARLRWDMKKSDVAVYGTGGMFLLVGLGFMGAALFLLASSRRRNLFDGDDEL